MSKPIKIYVIRSKQTKDVYVGSTTQPLDKILYDQKRFLYHYRTKPKATYITSFEIVKYDDAYIELLEECNTKVERFEKVAHYISELEAVNVRRNVIML